MAAHGRRFKVANQAQTVTREEGGKGWAEERERGSDFREERNLIRSCKYMYNDASPRACRACMYEQSGRTW